MNNYLKEYNKKERTLSTFLKIQSIYKTILLYCLKCRTNANSKNTEISKKSGRIMFLSKCAVRDNKKITIIKQQEARRLLSSLIVFCLNNIKQVNTKDKMNEIVNKFLLVGDKFMLEMHLKQPRFTYSACGPFTKNKERIENFKEKEIHDIFIKTK